jgi:uncharacterized membrane protein
MKKIFKRKVNGVEDLGFFWSLVSLIALSPILFFSATQMVPAAGELISLQNIYPEMINEPKAIAAWVLLIIWGPISILCVIFAQALNKNLVRQVLKGENY